MNVDKDLLAILCCPETKQPVSLAGTELIAKLNEAVRKGSLRNKVVGRRGRNLPLWKRLSGRSTLVQRLVEEAKGTTVVVLDTRELGSHPVAQLEKHVVEATQAIRPPLVGRPAASPLAETAVLIWDEPLDKETAMRQLLSACCRRNNKVPEEEAWRALTQREKQGSTFLGEDVALPHARLAGVEHAVVGLGLAKQGVSDAATGRSVRIVFLLLSPVSPPEVHVRYLSLISRLTQHALLRQEVLAARNAAEAGHVLKEHAARLEPHTTAPNGGKAA